MFVCSALITDAEDSLPLRRRHARRKPKNFNATSPHYYAVACRLHARLTSPLTEKGATPARWVLIQALLDYAKILKSDPADERIAELREFFLDSENPFFELAGICPKRFRRLFLNFNSDSKLLDKAARMRLQN